MAEPADRVPMGLLASALAALAMACSTPARAQSPAPSSFHPANSSHAAETLLRRAADQAKQGQWAEAIDLYQKVIADHADAMAEDRAAA